MPGHSRPALPVHLSVPMHSPLELTLVLLAAAVFGVVAFRMLQLPPMLGYLAVGILIVTPLVLFLRPLPKDAPLAAAH